MAIGAEILSLLAGSGQPLSSGELAARLQVGKSTIKRHLDVLLAQGRVIRAGVGRGTRYHTVPIPAPARVQEPGPAWQGQPLATRELRDALQAPLASREIVGYQRQFVDDYIPNQSFLLTAELAATLWQEGQMRGQQPAGTYVRKVLEQLLIDLAWSSSKLEGNTYSLLATEALFKSGSDAGDPDAVMLLNHKQAIEFMVDAVPEYGLTGPVVSNVHALLMQDLLPGADGLGTIRNKIVNISGTTYTPLQAPALLQEMFELIIAKSRQIQNPVEAAFFLWVNLAYLQPFEDGNKRTSRLAANIPLILCNSAPLSFLDADTTDYAHAMMGVYEQCNVALAVKLFEFLYRRSVKRYQVTIEAMGIPDPFRLRHREALNSAIRCIVVERLPLDAAMIAAGVGADNQVRFRELLRAELRVLDVHNCARYRLSMRQVSGWAEEGRPVTG